jgi:hypothetical protein
MGLTKTLLALSCLAFVSACATPEIVQTRKISDSSLTCSQLKNEIQDAEDFEAKARAERGMTGKNVAAALLFWPALLGTYSNTEEAMNAARGRQRSLYQIAREKNCDFAK